MKNQPLNVAIKLTRPDLLPLRVLLPKASPLKQTKTISNWTLHLNPFLSHPTLTKNNNNQSWLGSRQTKRPERWWYQWLLVILHTLTSLWCLPIGPVLTCPIYLLLPSLFYYWILNICFDVQLFYRACMGLTRAPLDYWQLGHLTLLRLVYYVLKNLFKWIHKIYSLLNPAAHFLYVIPSEAALWIIHISSHPILLGNIFMMAPYWVLL